MDLATTPAGAEGQAPLYRPISGGRWQLSEMSPAAAAEWIFRELRRCQVDPLYFVTHYCHAENLHDEDAVPCPAVELIPAWPHVRVLLSAFFPPRDVLIEKSRRMLASWVMMAAVLHDLLFRSQWPVMAMSRVEEDVDNGGERSTTRCLFGKVRFMWERLPPFLRVDEITFKHLRIVNTHTGAYCEGYSSSQSPGRGGGYRRAILDEFAWVPHSELVMSSVGQACASGKVLTSTPHGRGNAFYRIRQSAHAAFPKADPPRAPGQFARFTVHWSLHPLREAPWKQRLIDSHAMTEEAIAQELEIDYTGSVSRRVYPKYVEDQHMAGGALCGLASLAYDPSHPLGICCDFNHDPLVWELLQVYHGGPYRYRVIGEICQRNAVVDDALGEFMFRFGGRARREAWRAQHPDWARRYESDPLCVAGEHGHQAAVVIYGDATEEKSTVHNRVKTYQDIRRQLTDAGFQVRLKVPSVNPPRERRFQIVNDVLGRNLLVVAPGCEQLRKDFERGGWNGPQNDMDQTTEDDDGSHLTRSHASSALGYALCTLHITTATDAPMSRAVVRDPRSYFPEVVRGW